MEEYTVSYLKCQSCSGKIHCDQCSREIEALLLRDPRVRGVRADLNRHMVRLEADPALAEEILDDAGLFID